MTVERQQVCHRHRCDPASALYCRRPKRHRRNGRHAPSCGCQPGRHLQVIASRTAIIIARQPEPARKPLYQAHGCCLCKHRVRIRGQALVPVSRVRQHRHFHILERQRMHLRHVRQHRHTVRSPTTRHRIQQRIHHGSEGSSYGGCRRRAGHLLGTRCHLHSHRAAPRLVKDEAQRRPREARCDDGGDKTLHDAWRDARCEAAVFSSRVDLVHC